MNISYSAIDLYNKIDANGNSYISSYRKNVREADSKVQDLQKDIDGFRKSIRKLSNMSPDTITKNKLERYLGDFAKSYQKLRDSGEKITDKELSKTLSKLDEFMEENEKSLKKLGLKESKGKWTFDSELLEETKESDLNKLFEGKDAIFTRMNKVMRQVEKDADAKEYQTVLRQFHTVSSFSQSDMVQALIARGITNGMDSLMKSQAEVQGYNGTSDKLSEEIAACLERFCEDYNTLVTDSTEAVKEQFGFMSEKTKEQEEQLKNLGITMQDEKLNWTKTEIPDEAFKTSYAALFGENAAYGSLMKTYAKNIFTTTFKTESLGITIDSYA